MGEPEVATAIERLAARAPDGEVLTALEVAAIDVVVDDLVHRFLPYQAQLAQLDVGRRPAAALVVGAALCASDRSRGRALLADACEQFAAAGDAHGEGAAWFVLGLEDMSEGRPDDARAAWARARPLLDDVSASRMIDGHLALTALIDGELVRAVALAEHALWSSTRRGDARAEAIACVTLAYCHLHTGRFSRVDHLLALGRAACDRLPELDSYERPMLDLQQAALDVLRQRNDPARDGFHAAIAAAEAQGNEWYGAIARATRAELTGEDDPRRAMDDARIALAYFDRVDDRWWSLSALRGFAAAHAGLGNRDAAEEAFASALERATSPLDRGRALLVGARVTADRTVALERATSAVALLERAGAAFLAADAAMWLCSVDTRRREYHRRHAARLAGDDRSDEAWRCLLRGEGRLDIRLLDDSQVAVDGRAVRFTTRAELELVAMLALAPRGLSADDIADRLWPADDPARVAHRVHNLVSAVRRAIAPTSRIERTNGRFALDLARGECDVRDLVADATDALQHRDVTASQRAALADRLRLPLLDGRAVPWLLYEQDRLADLAARIERAASGGR